MGQKVTPTTHPRPCSYCQLTLLSEGDSGYQGDGRLCGALVSLGKGNGYPGGRRVTRGVMVFGQGQDRIINSQLRVKLKLPARRSQTLLEVLMAAEELPHLRFPPPLAPTSHRIPLTELMRLCPEDLLGKEGVRGREGHSHTHTPTLLSWSLIERT